MMGYLTRPGFNGGGSVKKKPVLPKRKPPEEVKKRQKINYEKIKQFLGEESRELIERELGFKIGGQVIIDTYNQSKTDLGRTGFFFTEPPPLNPGRVRYPIISL